MIYSIAVITNLFVLYCIYIVLANIELFVAIIIEALELKQASRGARTTLPEKIKM